MNYTYRVIIEPDEKVWRAWVPALPGCHTWGKTIEEAKKNIGEAMEAYIGTFLDLGRPIPVDNQHQLEMLTTVSLKEAKKPGKKAVARKSIKQLAHAYV